MRDRAGRWVPEQVGWRGRAVSDLVRELGCDWPAINDTVIAYGEALVDDPARIGKAHIAAWHQAHVSNQRSSTCS